MLKTLKLERLACITRFFLTKILQKRILISILKFASTLIESKGDFSMAGKLISVRVTDEMFEKLSKEGSGSEIIRQALDKHYNIAKDEAEKKAELVKITARKGTRALTLPVGDVLMRGMPGERTELWWCAEEHLDKIKSIAERFDGCELKVGQLGRGTEYMPEVIQEEWQERKRNGCFTPSCRMDEALIGDSLVWLEVVDSKKAMKSFSTYTDIPCPVRIDVIKYSLDARYKEACDRGNWLFRYYYVNKRALNMDASTHKDNALKEFCGA